MTLFTTPVVYLFFDRLKIRALIFSARLRTAQRADPSYVRTTA
jgi:hypothetical protein